jgi:hypothetical protein
MRRAENAGRIADMRNAYTVLVGKCQGKRPIERPKPKWEGSQIMYLRQTTYKLVNWFELADYEVCGDSF